MQMHLHGSLWILFEHHLPQRSSSAIGNVIQGDSIKAISAKWNMCPVSVAHSLFIRMFTSETNLEKQNKDVYGPLGWRSTGWCHWGDVLLADLFWILLTFPLLEGSAHLRVRDKGSAAYD